MSNLFKSAICKGNFPNHSMEGEEGRGRERERGKREGKREKLYLNTEFLQYLQSIDFQESHITILSQILQILHYILHLFKRDGKLAFNFIFKNI